MDMLATLVTEHQAAVLTRRIGNSTSTTSLYPGARSLPAVAQATQETSFGAPPVHMVVQTMPAVTVLPAPPPAEGVPNGNGNGWEVTSVYRNVT